MPTLRTIAFMTAIMSTLATNALFAQAAATEGPGSSQCSELVEAKNDKPENYREYAVWISGFLTAANAYEDETFDLTPWQPIEVSIAQITQFCEANPQAAVAQAMGAYVSYLKPNRLTEPESLTQLRNDNNAVFVYPSVLASIREKLIADGFLTDAAPAEFGPEIGQALQRFQQGRNLQPTGLPDARTLIALFN